MITLRNKLYESLLDDEDELVNNDEIAKEIQFYEECKKMLLGYREDYIRQNCEYNNGDIKLNVLYVSSINRSPNEYGDNIFKGFSVSSNISYIGEINIPEYHYTKQLDSSKYSVNKVNEYPMNIKCLNRLEIYSSHLLDYCKNIKIDEVYHLDFYMDKDAPFPTLKNFEFFKCIKKIGYARFRDIGTLFKYYTIIPSGTIRNINAINLDIHISQILPNVMDKSELNEENKPIFNDFMDDLYKYNNIEQIILTTHNRKTLREKRYMIEKGKTKKSKYLLKPL